MSKLKYIMTNRGPVIFSEALLHKDVAEGLKEISSAGFVYITWDEEEQKFLSKPHGESISLKIKSDPENDKRKIDTFLNGY